MAEVKVLTREGEKKLKEELSALKERRRIVMEKVKFARGLGDISENEEYASARDEQAYIDGKVRYIEGLLKNAKVVEKGNGTRVVGVGAAVKVKTDGEEIRFNVVGATEADPSSGKISCESPLGKALLGKKVGEVVDFEAPAGRVTYTVLKVD